MALKMQVHVMIGSLCLEKVCEKKKGADESRPRLVQGSYVRAYSAAAVGAGL